MNIVFNLLKSPKCKIFVLIVLSIFGLALPFVNYSLGWLVPFCLLPFLYLLQDIERHKYLKRPGIIVWLVGFGSFLIILSWCSQTSPEKWAFISGFWAIVALCFTYVGFALLFSLQYVVFWQLYKRLKVKLSKPSVVVLLPAIWVVSEFTRSLLFSFVLSGKGSSWGFYWNFGMLGIAGAVTPMGYMARIVGLAGLSFAIVALNVAIFMLLKKRWRIGVFTVIIVLVFTLLGWSVYSMPSPNTLSASVVQLSEENTDESGPNILYKIIGDVSRNTGETQSSDLLVLPEYSNYFTNLESFSVATGLARELVKDNAPIVTSVDKSQSKEVSFNRLVIYNNEGVELGTQDKSFLIPIGEYVPYLYQGLLFVFRQNATLALITESREVTKAAKMPTSILANGIRLGSQACSGAIAPELYRTQVRDGAEVLTNSANLGIFTKATLYHEQSRQFARFIAIANNRPYLQSATGGYSYIIDQNGHFVTQTTRIGNSFLHAQVNTQTTRTIYSVLGEYWLGISLFIILTWSLRHTLLGLLKKT